MYIGIVGGRFTRGFKEHNISNIAINKTFTGFSSHCLDTSHGLDTDNIGLLHTECKAQVAF